MFQYIASRNSHIPFTGLDGDLVAGHYDSLFKTIVGAEWGVKSDGDVESTAGYFAVVEVPLHLGERLEMFRALVEGEPEDDWHRLEAGWYVTRENDQGLIYVFRVPDQSTADLAFSGLRNEYYRWLAAENADG